MKPIYDQYYQEHDYFGNPYPRLMEFFQSLDVRGTVVDLGAGQGRDALMLSKLGYDVTAVDISGVGLAQIRERDPNIIVIQADINTFDVQPYNIILTDSMLHFYKRDLEKESNLVRNILLQMKQDAIWVNCLPKSKRAEAVFQRLLEHSGYTFIEHAREYIDYPEGNSQYQLLAIQKQ